MRGEYVEDVLTPYKDERINEGIRQVLGLTSSSTHN
jgi:hypothetical protein